MKTATVLYVVLQNHVCYCIGCTVAGVGKVILTELFASETKSDVDFICVS